MKICPPVPTRRQREMPLCRCPDCGRLVSLRAAACPHCGCTPAALAGAPPLMIDQVDEGTRDAAPSDLLDRPLLLDLHGMLHRFTLASGPGKEDRNALRPGKHYSVNWEAGLLFLHMPPAKGRYLMRSAAGKTYLLTPAGHVEFVIYQA